MNGFLLIVLILMQGCTASPSVGTPTIISDIEKFNAKVNSDLQKITPILIKSEPAANSLVDLGLALSGNGALIPINDLGAATLVSLQQSIVSKTGISAETATSLNSAAALGLKLSGNNNLIPYTPEATAVIVNAVNQLVPKNP